jgi:hypothetical protein
MKTKSIILSVVVTTHILFYAKSLTFAQTVDPQTGIIADIQPRKPGKLKVMQKRGEVAADATIGMPIRRGYLLTLSEGARATVVCDADSRKYELQPGPQPCPCVANRAIEEVNMLPRPRGDSYNRSFPIIVSPRATFLLTGRPRLSWLPALKSSADVSLNESDATYRVTIYTTNMKLVWSKSQVKGNNLAYPATERELEPGNYLLVVSTSLSSSDEEGGVGRGFTVLPKCPAGKGALAPCVRSTVRAEEQRINALHLSMDSTQLLLANLYLAHNLYAEAREKLEAALRTAKTPAIMRQLADTYGLVGLNREAEKLYLETLALPQIASDLEAVALTSHALAETYERLGVWKSARSHYDAAIEAYHKLNDYLMVQELEKQRDKLPR